MWNFKIKGLISLAFLCSIAHTQKILDPEEHCYTIDGSINNRLFLSTATESEKQVVMSNLKSILARIPDSTDWKHLAWVIHRGNLEEHMEDLGGKKSGVAVELLQRALNLSKNRTALDGYVDTWLEFISLGNVTRMDKMLVLADLLIPSEYHTWCKGNTTLADAMGVTKMFVFPQEQIDYLEKYWFDTLVLKNFILGDVLEKLSSIMTKDGGTLFMTKFLQLLQNFKNSPVITNSQNWTEIDSSLLFNGIDKVSERLLNPKLLDFNFTIIETIERNLLENPNFEPSLMKQMEDNRVRRYFNRSDKNYRAHALFNYTTLFIPAIKNYNKKQLNAFNKFLKEYTPLHSTTKQRFIQVMTTNMTRYNCWDTWKRLYFFNSEEMEKTVKLFDMFEEEFGARTCFSKIIDIRNSAQISKYWDENAAQHYDTLKNILPIHYWYKRDLDKLVRYTSTPSRDSYRILIYTVRDVTLRYSDFLDLIKNMLAIHGDGFEPIWMAMNQFFVYSEDRRQMYIDMHFANNNSTLGELFKMNIKNKYENKYVEDIDLAVLQPYEQWTYEQMIGIRNFVRKIHYMRYSLANEKNDQMIKTILRVLAEKVSWEECRFSWNYRKDNQLANEMRETIVLLDDTFGKMSCDENAPEN